MKTSEWNDQNVHEWLGNDEVLYEITEEALQQFPGDRESAAWHILRELNEMDIETTPDGAVYTFDNILEYLEE